MIFSIVSCVHYGHRPIKDLSFKMNRCRIQCYNVDKLKVAEDIKCGEDFESGHYPVEACEGIIGFDADYVAEDLKPKIKKNKKLCRRWR